MRGGSKRFRRSAGLLALLTILMAQAAVAGERFGDRGLRDRFEQAKRFIVVVFSRFGLPPG
jgi:hypothetical protein